MDKALLLPVCNASFGWHFSLNFDLDEERKLCFVFDESIFHVNDAEYI